MFGTIGVVARLAALPEGFEARLDRIEIARNGGGIERLGGSLEVPILGREVFHFDGVLQVASTEGRAAGRDPQNRSYSSWASFSDPDGNTWMLQEIKTRLPGRGLSNLDIPTLTELLRDAESNHGPYEAKSPKHHWSDWYAAYIVAREHGRTSEDAAADAARHMQGRQQ